MQVAHALPYAAALVRLGVGEAPCMQVQELRLNKHAPSVQASANTSVPPPMFFFEDTGYHIRSVK